MKALQGFAARRSPLAILVLALRLLGYAALFFVSVDGGSEIGDVPMRTVSPGVIRILIWMLALAGVGMFITDSARQFRALLFTHAAVSVLILMIAPLTPTLTIIHFIMLALSAGIHEPFPVNLVESGVFAIIVSLVYLVRLPAEFATSVMLLFICLAFALPSCLVTLFREQIIPLQAQVRRLITNVERLTRANSLTQDYARDVEDESRFAERQRLTRDIHDLVGYTFTNAIMMTEAAKVMVRQEPERIAEFMESIRTTMEDGLGEVKQSLRDLRNQDRPRQSIDLAMRKLVRIFSLSTGVSVRIEHGNSSWQAYESYADCVYHFVQEGLINAFRHGGAKRVIVFLWDAGDQREIRVDDDGAGTHGQVVAGIGLAGMHERAESHGGTVRVHPVPSGFSVSMYLPPKDD